MLNMLRFKKDGGYEKYREYAERNAALLAKVGGRLVTRWDARVTLVGVFAAGKDRNAIGSQLHARCRLLTGLRRDPFDR